MDECLKVLKSKVTKGIIKLWKLNQRASHFDTSKGSQSRKLMQHLSAVWIYAQVFKNE